MSAQCLLSILLVWPIAHHQLRLQNTWQLIFLNSLGEIMKPNLSSSAYSSNAGLTPVGTRFIATSATAPIKQVTPTARGHVLTAGILRGKLTRQGKLVLIKTAFDSCRSVLCLRSAVVTHHLAARFSQLSRFGCCCCWLEQNAKEERNS